MSNIKRVREEIESKGVRVLSKKYVSSRTRLLLECLCGKFWYSTLNNFRKNKTGRCPECNTLRGKDHPKFNPLLTLADRELRKPEIILKEYRDWSRKVFALYGKKCVISGRTTRLVVHHLFNRANNLSMRNNSLNGVPIIRKLHKEFHSRFGYNCSFEDFNLFYQEKTGKDFNDLLLEKVYEYGNKG